MYTHRISYESTNSHLGRVHHTFRTTEDALPIHLATLREREAAGTVINVTVHKLTFTDPSQRRKYYFVVNDTDPTTGRRYSRVDCPEVGRSFGTFTYEADALLRAEELEELYRTKEDAIVRRRYGTLGSGYRGRANNDADDEYFRRVQEQKRSATRANGQPLDTEE